LFPSFVYNSFCISLSFFGLRATGDDFVNTLSLRNHQLFILSTAEDS
jgi:hypothetical protein